MSAPPESRERDCQICPTAGIIGENMNILFRSRKSDLFPIIHVVVGDEILKGHVRDTNSHFLAQQLWKLGVRVQKVSVQQFSYNTLFFWHFM